jgi:hypothetical protein
MNLRNVNVQYIKGKYTYKKTYASLQDTKAKIFYSGPIEPMEPVFAKILTIMRTFMVNPDRLSNVSRKSLKLLQEMMKDPTKNFKNEGITHIIIYEHVQ